MELHEAIKNIVDTFGKDIITERRFLNMVADYYSFKDNLPGKRVLSALANGGYLSRLVGTYNERELTIVINQIKKDVENNYGFKQDLIEDILSSVVQGLDLKIAAPESKIITSSTQSINNSTQSINNKNHTNLIKYYLKAKDVSNNGFRAYNANGYYNAQNGSFLILKGSLLAFHGYRDAWLTKDEQKRKRIIESNCDYVSPNYKANKDILCSSPNEAAFVVTGTTMIGKIAWVDIKGKSLYQNDNKIIGNVSFDELVKRSENNTIRAKAPISSFVKTPSTQDRQKAAGGDTTIINNQNTTKNVNKHKQITSKITTNPSRDKKELYKILIPFVTIFVVGLFYSLKYLGSSVDREQYENRVFTGNSFMSNGDYDNAVESYKEAYNGYNAMNSDSYKEDALEKIENLVDKLIKEGETNRKSLVQANKALESALLLNLKDADKDRLGKKKEELEKNINSQTENGLNTLITLLSANNGKLDESGKKLLEDLLELSPNDYWLKFIKEKSYE